MKYYLLFSLNTIQKSIALETCILNCRSQTYCKLCENMNPALNSITILWDTHWENISMPIANNIRLVNVIWVGSWNFRRICKQRTLRLVFANWQTSQSLHCWHQQSLDIKEQAKSDQIKYKWIISSSQVFVYFNFLSIYYIKLFKIFW